MLATPTMESSCVRTQNQVTTVCPARHVSPAHSLLEEGWNRQEPKNRYEFLLGYCLLASHVHFLNIAEFLLGLQTPQPLPGW